MPTVQHLSAYDLASFRIGNFAVATASATPTTVTLTLGAAVVTLTGTFTVSGGLPVSGLITGLAFRTGATQQFAMTGLVLPWARFEDAMGNDDFGLIMAFADTVSGTASDDRLRAYAGDDSLAGQTGDDTIFGGSGDDTLDGGIGADLLQGGSGDDLYLVDSLTDRVVEFAGAGRDRVETALTSYTLGNNLEDLSFAGTADFSGTGNALNNLIVGSAGNDSLSGLEGNDTLRGGNGDDTLLGGNGNDWLIGDAGASFVTTTASAPSPADPEKPITLSMTMAEVTSSPTTTVSGYINNATLGGAQFNLAFVLDVSGSMADGFSGAAVGDRNGDGVANDKIDAAIASFEALVASIEASGLGDRVRISVIPFESSSSVLAVGTATSDANGDGIADVIGAVRGLQASGGTAYDQGLANAVSFFNGSPAGDNFVFFLSDGQPNSSNYDGFLQTLRDPAGINADIRSIGIEAASYYNVLDLLDDNSLNGTAINVTAPSDLTAGLLNSQVDVAEIDRLEIYLNGVLVTTLLPSQLTETPFGLQYSYTLTGLDVTGADKVETRLVLTDPAAGFVTTSQIITGGTLISDDRLVGGAGNDTLDGGAGRDTLIGGDGDDLYLLDSTNDVIIETAGQGTDQINSSVSFSLNGAAFGAVENLQLLGSLDLSGTGNALNNRIVGNIGNNVLMGLGGSDTVIGGFGTDEVSYEDLTSGVSANLATGLATGTGKTDILIEIENLTGSDYADSLTGNAGDNLFLGLSGADTINGGAGRDTLSYERSAAAVTVNLNISYGGGTAAGGEGADSIAAVENIIGSRFGDTITDQGYYIDLHNVFHGGAGADTLRGGYGSDTLYGGSGNDSLDGGVAYSTSYNDIDVLDYSSATAAVRGVLDGEVIGTSIGRDTVINFERIIATAFNDSLTGSALNERIEGGTGTDTLRGGAGNDTLDGGAGEDSLAGGDGNDVFLVDSANDAVSELAGGGNDTVQSAVSYTISDADVEALVLLGGDDLNGTGNASGNTITGNIGANRLSGLDGNDVIFGGNGDDTILGGDGSDSLNGGAGIDTVSYQGSAAGVNGSLNSTSTSTVLTLTGSDTIAAFENMIGSSFNDTLTGDYYENGLFGGAGNDQLYGGSDNDTLSGGAGNDLLDGGSGRDSVTYQHLGFAPINANLTTGLIIGDGTDTIAANSIENLTGTNGADVIAWTDTVNSTYTDYWLTGLGGNDSLVGSDGDDTLDGGLGADTMVGGRGYDVYYVNDVNDVVTENVAYGGYDRVISSITSTTLGADIEYLTLTGAAVSGFGNTLANEMIGNDRNNLLRGGTGGDTLTGGLGQDTLDAGLDTSYDYFTFTSVEDSEASAMDVIENFDASRDTIYLYEIDANSLTSTNDSFTFIGAAAFSNAAGQLRVYQAGGSTYVAGDVDGDGSADFGIRLVGLVALTSSEFYL